MRCVCRRIMPSNWLGCWLCLLLVTLSHMDTATLDISMLWFGHVGHVQQQQGPNHTSLMLQKVHRTCLVVALATLLYSVPLMLNQLAQSRSHLRLPKLLLHATQATLSGLSHGQSTSARTPCPPKLSTRLSWEDSLHCSTATVHFHRAL